ncbi:hypothetical protein AXF42_Ash003359 [Apostasia shenzhenica]|uniref:Histidine protein methyltransferase 1 like n=1 Tax=Apostasia shenzhenica TaxID=1088818 RepID=A0A2I0BG05_9ASPA|nr:hypothetical protein AXF42_Ash003359 [Apostasia shenzhenica]
MRGPALLFQCLPGLINYGRTGLGDSVDSERGSYFPSPAVEVFPSKGRVSVAGIIGFTSLEMISSKPDGHLKSCESSIDLVNVLKNEIRDGQLTFRGKRVLEGATTVHFQDLNAETIRCTTIPNVLANLEQARDRQGRQLESSLTPSRQQVTHDVHFYAGNWDELPTILSLVGGFDCPDATVGQSLSFSEEEFMEGYSSQEGSVISHEAVCRRSRKLSGSRAWERATEADQRDGGYDIVLVTEIPHLLSSIKKLYKLIIKCLRPPYGVLYIAAKKNFVGLSGGVKQLRSMVDEEGLFGARLMAESSDREIWKFFFRK